MEKQPKKKVKVTFIQAEVTILPNNKGYLQGINLKKQHEVSIIAGQVSIKADGVSKIPREVSTIAGEVSKILGEVSLF